MTEWKQVGECLSPALKAMLDELAKKAWTEGLTTNDDGLKSFDTSKARSQPDVK